MTPKQQRFVQEYLVDLNATQAAIRAGYSTRTATAQGSRLLSNVEVAAGIAQVRQSDQQRTSVSRERVLRELAAIGMADVRKLYDPKGNLRPIHELDDDTAASISGIETDEILGAATDEGRQVLGYTRKVKRFDKTKALELLGRHLGLWEAERAPENVGPGLTVIVQQAVQVQGQQAAQQHRVEVNLPRPA